MKIRSPSPSSSLENQKYSRQFAEYIMMLHENGHTIRQISEGFGLSYQWALTRTYRARRFRREKKTERYTEFDAQYLLEVLKAFK